jgi:hypothetical protein
MPAINYLVSVSFDIKDGDSEDYRAVYASFEKIGLTRRPKAENGEKVLLPTTMALGEFEATDSATIRDLITEKCVAVFKANNLNGELFVSTGEDWARIRSII